jgi:hypothetical protein
VDDKLRTVLWQWRGQLLPEPFVADVRRWLERWDAGPEWLQALRELLAPDEVQRLRERGEDLVETGRHPQPSPDWPAIPWPPF